jgi:hypothetical protein
MAFGQLTIKDNTMKIQSILRNVPQGMDIPQSFVVGSAAVENGSPVKSIKFYETGAFSSKAFRGSCYVITYEASELKTIVPSSTIIDVSVDASSNKKQEQIPELPED